MILSTTLRGETPLSQADFADILLALDEKIRSCPPQSPALVSWTGVRNRFVSACRPQVRSMKLPCIISSGDQPRKFSVL